MSAGADALTEALEALAAAATTAGLDAEAARAEGEAVAATVAERSRGSFVDWLEGTGRDRTASEDFFEAAKRGNRFRVGPTPLAAGGDPAYVAALGEVATTAVLLGSPSPEAAGVAIGLSAAQRVVAPARQPVPGVSDELLAGLESRSRDVLSMLAKLDAPLGRSAIVTDAPLGRPTTGPAAPLVEQRPSPGEGAHVETPAATAPDPTTPPAPPAAPEPPAKTVEELLAELDGLVGLTGVKAEIHRQAAVLRVEGLRKEAGLTSPTITRHLVFNGNPGTGKTTVARLVAGIYRALGLLSKGQLVEVDRSELVAGFLGQTALKTAEVVKSAIGGVLFIDEAYALASGMGDQYGQEAIDTLVKEMEDHRNDLVVIVAGYPVPMAIFIDQNPGLASRFRTTIDFPDYSDDELAAIFEVMATEAQYDADAAVVDRLRGLVGTAARGPTFGNARYVRNVMEAAIGQHAWRLRDVAEPTVDQLRRLDPADLAPPVETVDLGPTPEPTESESSPPPADGLTARPPEPATPADGLAARPPEPSASEPPPPLVEQRAQASVVETPAADAPHPTAPDHDEEPG